MGLSTVGEARLDRSGSGRTRKGRVHDIAELLDDEVIDESSGLTDREQFWAWMNDPNMSPTMVSECMRSYSRELQMDVTLAHHTVKRWRELKDISGG